MLDSDQDLPRRLAEFETLLEIGVELASSLRLTTVLELALQKAEELCRAETSSIWEVDEEEKELFFRVVRGRAADEIRDFRIPLGSGIVGSVAQSQRAEVVNNVGADSRWEGEAAGEFETRAMLTVPLIARGRAVGVLQLLNPVGKDGFDSDDLRRMELFAGPLAQAVVNARLYASQKRLFVDTVTALAEAIEKRDPYTGGHVRRVVCYSLLLAREMGASDEGLEEIRLAATLHDVGKIGVPDEILGKPAPLDANEQEVMKRHVLDGAEIVSRIRELRRLVPGVRNHHERMDGRGYPDALEEGEIPLMARIIAVADTFDAMTTSRPYRQGLPDDEAAAEIQRCGGVQFCPRVVGAFARLHQRGRFTLEVGEKVLTALSESLSESLTESLPESLSESLSESRS